MSETSTSAQWFFFAAAALAVAYQTWRGWRRGAMRQVVSLLAIVAAYLTAYFGGQLAVPLFRNSYPDLAIRAVAGAVIGGAVFCCISLAGTFLFKRTAQQPAGIIRLAYGVTGSAIGVLFGIVTVMAALLMIRLLGSFGHEDGAVSNHRELQRSGGTQRSSQPLVLQSIARLKRSIDEGPAGPVVDEIDPVPATTYSVLGKMGRALTTPERAARFFEYPGAKSLAEHPRIVALRDDPAINKHLRERNYLPLLRNEHIIAAANDPELSVLLRKFELEKALDYALNQPPKKRTPDARD